MSENGKNLMFKPYKIGDASAMVPPAHDGCDCSERYVVNLTEYKRNPFR